MSQQPPLPPTFTMDDLAAINRAIASGHKTVQYGGKTLTYTSLAEMFQVRALIMRELGLTGSGLAYPQHDKRVQ